MIIDILKFEFSNFSNFICAADVFKTEHLKQNNDGLIAIQTRRKTYVHTHIFVCFFDNLDTELMLILIIIITSLSIKKVFFYFVSGTEYLVKILSFIRKALLKTQAHTSQIKLNGNYCESGIEIKL